jgi:hypothetical protein
VIQCYFSIIILASMSVILNVASRDASSHLMRPVLHAVRSEVWAREVIIQVDEGPMEKHTKGHMAGMHTSRV